MKGTGKERRERMGKGKRGKNRGERKGISQKRASGILKSDLSATVLNTFSLGVVQECT